MLEIDIYTKYRFFTYAMMAYFPLGFPGKDRLSFQLFPISVTHPASKSACAASR